MASWIISGLVWLGFSFFQNDPAIRAAFIVCGQIAFAVAGIIEYKK